MSRIVTRLLLAVILLALLFGFVPISRALLHSVNGSFAPRPYSALALRSPSEAVSGVEAGQPVPVRVTNETGHIETYHWIATQGSTLVSLGEETVRSGQRTIILVPSQGAARGKMQISLKGTRTFVTVPILKARP
jgi:hypothetical protein